MNHEPHHQGTACEGTLLILPDGRILARNVSGQLAEMLQTLSPGDEQLAERLRTARGGAPGQLTQNPSQT